MKIPTKVKIGGHQIKIIQKKLRDGLDGEADTGTNTISIDIDLPPSQKMATLIHEALHMMNATWGETHIGHMLLESLSQQMFQFLVDNRMLK